MTRKDTILIAVVVNAGLLAMLFTTAVIYDTDGGNEQTEFEIPLVENKTSSELPAVIAAASTGDEVDNVLKYYAPPVSHSIAVEIPSEVYIPHPHAIEEEEDSSPQERFIEVTVKRGDMLEKIARANKTTVGAIKRANQLESEHLTIGQVIKIPLPQSEPHVETQSDPKKEAKAGEPVYYVIKSGDNPWKIAKQFGVKYDEILRLNNLNEDKARNLKIGDRIRVK